jgi:hypothetical protein
VKMVASLRRSHDGQRAESWRWRARSLRMDIQPSRLRTVFPESRGCAHRDSIGVVAQSG